MRISKNIITRSKAKLTSLLKVAEATKAYVRGKLRGQPDTAPRFTVNAEASEDYEETVSPRSCRDRPPTPYPGGPVSRRPTINYMEGSSIADVSTEILTTDRAVSLPRTRHSVIGNGNTTASGNSQNVQLSRSSPATGSSSAAATTTRRFVIGGPSSAPISAIVSPVISVNLATPNLAISPRSHRLARRDVNRMWRMRMAHARNRASFPAGYVFGPAQEYYLQPAHSSRQTDSEPFTRDVGTQTDPMTYDQGTQTSPQVLKETAQSVPSAPSSRNLPSGGSSADTLCGSPVWGAPLPRKRAREFIKGYGRLEDPFAPLPPQPVFVHVDEQAPAPEQPQVDRLANLRSALTHPKPQAASSGSDARRWSDYDSDVMPSTGRKHLVRLGSNDWQMQQASAQEMSSGVPAAAVPKHCMDTSSRAWSSGSSDESSSNENGPMINNGSPQVRVRPQDSVSQQDYRETPEQHPQGPIQTPAAANYDPLAPYGPVYITPGQVLLTGEYRGEWDSQVQNRADPFELHFGGDPRLDAVLAAAEQYDYLYRANRALMHNNELSIWKVNVLEGELLRRNQQVQEQEAELLFLRARLEQVEGGSMVEGTVVHNKVTSVDESEEDDDMYGS